MGQELSSKLVWNSHMLIVGMWNTMTLADSLDVFEKVKHRPTIWSNYFSVRYLHNRKECIALRKAFILMFITVWVRRAPNWKQSKSSSIREWINKLWYSHRKDTNHQWKGMNCCYLEKCVYNLKILNDEWKKPLPLRSHTMLFCLYKTHI